MKKLFKTLFFTASCMLFCIFINCTEAFAATTTVCEKTGDECNICRKESCTHKEGQFYDNIVYYFCGGDQLYYMNQDVEKLVQSGEVKKENIVAVQISSNQQFKNEWNKMGDSGNFYIRAVIINMHGSATENALSYGGSTKITEGDIEKRDDKGEPEFKPKPVERLVLLSCYGAQGYLTDKNNMAKVFLEKIMGGEVIAGSEKVYPQRLSNGHIGSSDWEYYIYYVAATYAENENGEFTISKTYNDGYDWILYDKTGKRKVCSGDGYSINALLVLGKPDEEDSHF